MHRRLLYTLVAVAFAFAFVLTGCGASGGDASLVPTTAEVTTAQLESILPTAADIGPDYSLVESSNDDDEDEESSASEPDEADAAEDAEDEVDPSDDAFEQACPKAKALDLMDDEANDDEVSVEFETEDDRGIEVTLDPTPKAIDEATIDQIIEAYNDCGVIEFEDPESGPVKMELSARRLEGVGDVGIELALDTELALFGVPVTITFRGYLFDIDGVGVSVTASSGLDPSTFGSVPGDDDLLPELAAEMDQRVRTLTD